MKSLSEYLRDKDVVLVGPSDGYTGSGRGEAIDRAQCVVRMNWGCPVPSERHADLGTRTDVLYKRMLSTALPTHADVAAWVDDGVQWVVTSDTHDRSANYLRIQRTAKGRFGLMNLGRLRRQILDETGNSPLMALLAVTHLLQFPIRSLTIMNCDFYAGGYHAGYGGKEYRRSMKRAEGQIADVHDPVIQLRYLANLRAKDARLKFDDPLEAMARSVRVQSAVNGVVAVIPARYASGRFPGKPLAPIHGKPMILHVCEAVSKAVDVVIVATDDERIAQCVEAQGYSAVMTGDAETGTDRVAEAVAGMDVDVIVNVQGDEPLVDPEDILALVEAKRANPSAVVNGMCALTGKAADRTVVKAAVAGDGRLLYASRAPIPATKTSHSATWKQLGLYAYSPVQLDAFRRNSRGSVEQSEDVEILRFLDLGIPVQMVEVKGTAQAVDLPGHIEIVESLMREAVPA